MRKPRPQPAEPLPMLPPLAGWITSMPAETLEAAGFRSGAALAHLALVAATDAVPQALWRDRLALAAAEACAGFSGRRETAGALRDALHLAKAGDDPGPAGRLFRHWSRAAARPLSVAGLARALEGAALEGVSPERIALCLDAAGATPVDRAAAVLESVLEGNPRAETAALILADAVLSRATGRDHLLPLLALALTSRDLRRRGDDLRLACHRAVVAGARQALSLASDLARRAAALRAAAPQLRARAAGQAVDMFLSRDALAPGALTFMSDRAARRLCDRLVAMDVLRELTGRAMFRLYGV
jgi:hypothetical protein